MNKKTAITGIIILALVFLGIAYSYGKDGNRGPASDGANILGLRADKPNIIVDSEGLSVVEIWVKPTGTGVMEEKLWGKASLVSETENRQIWTYQVPSEPELITEVYAKGFDKQGALADTEKLPQNGATDIYNSLWEEGPEAGTSMSEEAMLRIGEVRTFGPLTLKVVRIVEDSRCPLDVQCIQAGRAAVEFELKKGTLSEKITMRSDEKRLEEFADFTIELVGVKPDVISTASILPGDYRVTIRVRN